MATFQVAADNEDGGSIGTDEYIGPSEGTFGVVYLGDPLNDDTPHDGGWIFRGTGIPQGATINTCTITLRNDPTDLMQNAAGAYWGFAVDSPSVFAAAHTHRISDHHTRTTATVSAPCGTVDPFVSPPLVTIAQEIVNQAGFAGDLGFTWRSTETGGLYYTIKDFAGGTGFPALTITWQAAAVSVGNAAPLAATQRQG